MAASDRFRIRVKGRGGHGAAPHQTVDAIVEAAAVVTALQTVVSRSNVRGAFCCVNIFLPYCCAGDKVSWTYYMLRRFVISSVAVSEPLGDSGAQLRHH